MWRNTPCGAISVGGAFAVPTDGYTVSSRALRESGAGEVVGAVELLEFFLVLQNVVGFRAACFVEVFFYGF